MLWRWNLARLCIFMRPFIWQKIWTWHLGCGPKNSKKAPQNWFFGSIFWSFSTISKSVTYATTNIALHYFLKSEKSLTAFGGVMTQKTPKMAQFMDAPSPRKLLKIYNLRTTNAMKMKLGAIEYLQETFHLTKNLGVTLTGWQGVAKEPLKRAKKIGFFAPFLGIFRTISKTITYVILCFALRHWWKFGTNQAWFGVAVHEKPPKSSQKSPFFH